MKNHPVEYVVRLEGKTLADLMPFLELRWNLEESAGKEPPPNPFVGGCSEY
jgi:hypothetical protein